jgi:ABC-type transporter MlaC component
VTQLRRSGPGLALALALLTALISGLSAQANSPLLDTVKKNPQQAKALCNQLKALNAQGISYTSPQAIAQIAAQQGLNNTDAEILSTYVVGLYCPDVR